jgi:hypothetical protein
MGRVGDLLGGSNTAQPTRIITVFTKALPEAIELPSTDLVFSDTVVNSINKIDASYTSLMANRYYEDIPGNNLNGNMELYDEVGTQYELATNDNLRTLLKITLDGLTGSINGYALFTQNLTERIKNDILQKRIEDILSGKNEKSVITDTCGGFGLTKTFTLAPLYSYYIAAFGMPAFGVGFDTDKLSLMKKVLEAAGIDPNTKNTTYAQ